MKGPSVGQASARGRPTIGLPPAPSPSLLSREVCVLFVHREASHLRKFQEIVADEAVTLRLARDLGEASRVMQEAQPPHVVFTDTKLSDGDWQDVLTLAVKAAEAVNVVVVSAVGNISLYTEAIERGAFDFLTPNIAPRDFPLLLQAAVEDAVARRAGNRGDGPLRCGGTVLVAEKAGGTPGATEARPGLGSATSALKLSAIFKTHSGENGLSFCGRIGSCGA